MAHSRWVFTVPSVINAPAHGRRRVLHYSHHSTGLGHLVRSLAVAGALAEQAEVLFCSGGRVPQQMAIPAGVRLVTLPPIGTGERGAPMSLDPGYTLEEAWEERRRELLGCFDEFNPDALLVELFPFGRRKFAGELTPCGAQATGCSPVDRRGLGDTWADVSCSQGAATPRRGDGGSRRCSARTGRYAPRRAVRLS